MVYYTAEEFENLEIDKKSENSDKIDNSSSLNNGGTTGYYDLPVPTRTLLQSFLKDSFECTDLQAQVVADTIYEMFPATLNDLIEYKNMLFWRGEVFKAVYALDERAVRSSDNASIRRELNKILYYAKRAIAKENRDANTK